MGTTVGEVLTKAAKFLAPRVPVSPRADAEILMGQVLGCERLDVYRALDRPIDDDERDRFREMIRRRATGEPIAYITGVRGFWTLDLHVSPAVLIPRPETEGIIEAVLEFVGDDRARPWRIVDVGTGSGAIALALAAELPNATVVGIDISPEALAVAAENADSCGARDRVRLVRGDGLAPMIKRGSSADIVVSNPPYIAAGDPRLEAQVVDWEPEVALISGDDGLAMIRELICDAARVLTPEGFFAMEFGRGQAATISALAESHFGTVRIARDLSGIERVLIAHREVASGENVPGEGTHGEAAVGPHRAENSQSERSIPITIESPEGDSFAEDARVHETRAPSDDERPSTETPDPRLLGGASGREPIPVIDLNAE